MAIFEVPNILQTQFNEHNLQVKLNYTIAKFLHILNINHSLTGHVLIHMSNTHIY